jgi:hypothetical protein
MQRILVCAVAFANSSAPRGYEIEAGPGHSCSRHSVNFNKLLALPIFNDRAQDAQRVESH